MAQKFQLLITDLSTGLQNFKMHTTSEKYNWINEHIFIGDSIELVGSTEKKAGRRAFMIYTFRKLNNNTTCTI